MATATTVDVQDLPDPTRHPKLLELEADADRLAREKLRLEAAVDQARARFEESEAHEHEVRVKAMLGPGDPDGNRRALEALEAARTALTEAVRDTEAIADAEQRAIELIGPVRDAALDEARRAFHIAYAEVLEEHVRRLLDAAETNRELYAIFERAEDIWGPSTSERADGAGRHPSYGGLMRLAWPALARSGERLHHAHVGFGNKSKLESTIADGHDRGWLE